MITQARLILSGALFVPVKKIDGKSRHVNYVYTTNKVV